MPKWRYARISAIISWSLHCIDMHNCQSPVSLLNPPEFSVLFFRKFFQSPSVYSKGGRYSFKERFRACWRPKAPLQRTIPCMQKRPERSKPRPSVLIYSSWYFRSYCFTRMKYVKSSVFFMSIWCAKSPAFLWAYDVRSSARSIDMRSLRLHSGPARRWTAPAHP